jgi:MFS family permease
MLSIIHTDAILAYLATRSGRGTPLSDPAGTMTQSSIARPAAQKSERIGRLLAFLLPAAIAMTSVFQGVQLVLLPAQVEDMDPAHKVGNLALLTSFAAIGSLVGIPFGGFMSDRTRSRFGRRAPWVVGLSVLSGVLLITMGLDENLIVLAVCYSLLWFTASAYQGALFAILPDRVPVEHRGSGAAIVGLATPLGVFVGVQVASHVTHAAGYSILAILLVLASVTLVFAVPERPSNGPIVALQLHAITDSRQSKASDGFLGAFLRRDFTLAFISRFALFLSYFTVSGYLFYSLGDFIGHRNVPGRDVPTAVSTLLTVSVVGWVVFATFFGWFADKIDRRKLFVGMSALGLGTTMLIPILSPTWSGMLIYSALLGVFMGVYFAVDLAVMSLVLPRPDRNGRDFGILAVATGLPQLMSAAIAGILITFLGGYVTLYLFGAGCALVGGGVALFIRSVR